VRIATWNVNSLKARLPRVEEWLVYAQPDVLCMQETKLSDLAFPAMAFAALGYEAVHHGDGRWNGVAILSRVGISQELGGFVTGVALEGEECRIVSALCGGVHVSSVYVPNGRAVGTEHYEAKLEWLARLRRHLDTTVRPDEPVVVCGDFNVAPTDRDVWDPAAVHGATHVSQPEREALERVEEFGLQDAFRLVYPDQERLFSWWDYRAGDFHQGRGMRIDLVLVSKVLADSVGFALIDRNARKGKLPSDHAPVLVDVNI
jgi:exodeoxyribonuclease-3